MRFVRSHVRLRFRNNYLITWVDLFKKNKTKINIQNQNQIISIMHSNYFYSNPSFFLCAIECILFN